MSSTFVRDAPWNFWKCLLGWEFSDEILIHFTFTVMKETDESDEDDMKVICVGKRLQDTIRQQFAKTFGERVDEYPWYLNKISIQSIVCHAQNLSLLKLSKVKVFEF